MHIFSQVGQWPDLGVGSANFRKRGPPTETRLEGQGEEEGDEEEEGRNPIILIAAATKFPM